MLQKKNYYQVIIVPLLLGLSACAQMHKTDYVIDQKFNKTNDISKSIQQYQPNLISYNDNIYVSAKPFKRFLDKNQLPKIFTENITFNTSQPLSLQEIIKIISTQIQLPVRLTSDAINTLRFKVDVKKDAQNADSASESSPVIFTAGANNNSSQYQNDEEQAGNTKITLYYSGEVGDFLSLIAANYGLWWRYNQNNKSVDFYYYETRMFTLDMLLGSSTTKTMVESNSSSVEGVQNTQTTYDSEDNKPWSTAVETISLLVGKDGHVESSPKNGYITVVATPLVMEKIAEYVETLNQISRKRIAIKVDVYDVQQTNAQNYGLNWEGLYKITAGILKWNTSAVPVALTDALSSNIQTANITGELSNGPFSGSYAVIDSLNKLGKTSKVTGTTVYTVNGRSVPIQVSRSKAYIKQMTVHVSEKSIQKSATPGMINAGYFITVTPKIIANNEVMVNLSANISTLLQMENAKVDDTGSYLQLPDILNKSFMQAVPLVSGQTVVLAGFDNSEDTFGKNSVVPNSIALGGNSASHHNRTVTVIIVTPYIVSKD